MTMAMEWTVASKLPHLKSSSRLPYVSCVIKTTKKQWEERVHAVSGKLEKGNFIDALQDLDFLRLPPQISEVPPWIGRLNTLTELHIAYCENLPEIPDFIGAVSSLVYLNLAGCKRLVCLPWSLGNLSYLAHINLAY